MRTALRMIGTETATVRDETVQERTIPEKLREATERTAPVVRLCDAPMSEWHRIDSLDGPEMECRRLLDLGFTPGEDVAVVRSTPLGDPLVVIVRGTQLALRKREASWIRVIGGSDAGDLTSKTSLQ
jgi:ferrous iron transport protein A